MAPGMVWFEPLTLMFLNIEAFNGHFDVGLQGQTLKPKEITSKGGKEYLWVLLKNSDSWEEKWYHLSSPKTLSPTPPAPNPTQINIDHSVKGLLSFLPLPDYLSNNWESRLLRSEIIVCSVGLMCPEMVRKNIRVTLIMATHSEVSMWNPILLLSLLRDECWGRERVLPPYTLTINISSA